MSSHLPGYETGFTATPREVLFSREGVITGGIVVDGNLSIDGSSPSETYDLRPGWLMGRVTASGRWTPCKRTRTKSPASSAESSAAGDFTVVPVDVAAPFRVGDVITIGSDSSLTVTAVDYVHNRLTVDDAIPLTADELVTADDGSGTCRGILLDFVRLRNDDNTASIHKSATLLVQGMVKTAMLLGDVDAVRSDTDAKMAGIRFTDDHGMG